MALRVSIFRNGFTGRIDRRLLRQAAQSVLSEEGIRTATVRIVLSGDSQIQELNRRYLQHDYPTDVLTFVLQEVPLELELYIGAQQACRQAQHYGVPFTEELVRLIVHGLLHALGYQDHTAAQRRRMFRRQEEYVRCLCATLGPGWP